MDPQAVSSAFSKYLVASNYNITQIRFIKMIIEQLTKNGALEIGQLYEPPFNGIHYQGIDGIFKEEDANEVVSIVKNLSVA